jgi:hypothetical protein
MIAALGCALAATSLTACGGTHNGTSVVPAQHADGQQQPSGKGRRTHSGCTPDSYGYCVVLVSRSHGDKIYCDDGVLTWHYATMTTVYELYYNNADQGTYTYSMTDYGCPGDPMPLWDPGDPAVVTGDPNLP